MTDHNFSNAADLLRYELIARDVDISESSIANFHIIIPARAANHCLNLNKPPQSSGKPELQDAPDGKAVVEILRSWMEKNVFRKLSP